MSTDQPHVLAHSHSMRNRQEIGESTSCGCFHCHAIFPPTEVVEWVDEGDQTALCPYCGIDSVIGSASGYPITRAFLGQMRKRWFGSRLLEFLSIPAVIAVSFGIMWVFWKLVSHAIGQ